mgnify:CR=1 FL=1
MNINHKLLTFLLIMFSKNILSQSILFENKINFNNSFLSLQNIEDIFTTGFLDNDFKNNISNNLNDKNIFESEININTSFEIKEDIYFNIELKNQAIGKISEDIINLGLFGNTRYLGENLNFKNDYILINRYSKVGLKKLILKKEKEELFVTPNILIGHQFFEYNIEEGELMTSANGVRAFVKRSKSRNLIVYAVGDGTANEAKNQGFSSVKSASGDVVALTKLVNKFVKPENGLLYHIRGSHVAGNLKQQLISHGYKYRSDILYRVTEAERFSQHTITSFYARKIGAVLLYSPRTAKIFCKLIKAESIGGKLDSVVAFCLSESVAENISMFVWKKIIISDKPNQSSLLERIRQEL